tara:strand:- start:227 stop:1615 length:1389 start_codon:yes stop_codon:yes gene_type:complete
MSGWFGTSNRDTNNALDGIRAGHARRRNMQRQRYDSGIFGRRLGSHAEGHEGAHNETYRGFSLTFLYNGQFNIHTTKAWRIDKSFSATGQSRGQASNKVKQKIDEFLGPGDGIPNGGNNGGNDEFTPVAMPNNYVNGGYQVIAIYHEMMQKYQVAVYTPDGGVGESVRFGKTEGVAASAKHAEFVALVDQKVAYEAQIPLTTDKNPYIIKLIVEGETILSGFFSGLFGLGNWAATPARTFRVVVQKLDSVTPPGTVDNPILVTKYNSGTTPDYALLKAEFDNQVSLVENNFYDESDPLIPEVPTNDGEGGDITNGNDDVPLDPWIEQAQDDAEAAAIQLLQNEGYEAAAAAAALLAEQEAEANAQAAAMQLLQNEAYAAAEAAAAAAAQATADGETIMQNAENYNQMVARQQPVLIDRGEPTYETQTTTRSSGGHNHITADIGLTLAAIGLVGMVYLAVKDE